MLLIDVPVWCAEQVGTVSNDVSHTISGNILRIGNAPFHYGGYLHHCKLGLWIKMFLSIGSTTVDTNICGLNFLWMIKNCLSG